MFAYLLLLMAATLDAPKPVKPTIDPIPAGCFDGTISPNDSRCPPQQTVPHMDPIYDPPLAMPDKSQRATPNNNPGSWVTTVDYPSAALRNEEEGTTGFRLTVGVDGRATGCTVTQSSGFSLLDEATCRNILRRALLFPARDGNGQPVVGSYSNRVTWRIPDGPSYAYQINVMVFGAQPRSGSYITIDESDYPLKALEGGMRGNVDLLLTVSAEGEVTDCAVENSSGHAILDGKSCEVARWWRFVPALGAKDKAVASKTNFVFNWILPEAWKAYQQTGLYPKKPVQ